MRIGREQNWNFTIDDFYISSDVSEASSLRNPSAPTLTTNTLVYYDFNEGSGNVLNDLSSNNLDGTITDPSWNTIVNTHYLNNCKSTDQITVSVNSLPTIDLGTDTTLICDGTSETIDAGTGFSSYLWSDGSTAQTLSATSAGTYTVNGTDANGCEASDSMVIDVLTVNITQNDTTICEGDSLVLFAENLYNGLVGYWPFNGNTNDKSGNGNNGTNYGATLTADRFGNANSAYSFDGIDDYIKVSDHPTLNPQNEISINVWFKVETAFDGLGNDALIDKPFTSHVDPFYQYHLGLSGLNENVPFNGVIESDISADGVRKYIETTSGSYELNQWYMLTFTYDGSKIKLYQNNNLQQELSVLGPIDSYGQDLFFGAFGNLSSFTPVTLDEVAIWGRALNELEVQKLYNNYSYSWSPGGETTSSISIQPTTNSTFTVDVTSGSTTCTSDPTIITVQPLPTVDLGADVVICNGAAQTLDAGSHVSYLWNTGETTQTIDITTAGTYYVTIQDATGCEASDTLIATEKILAVDAGTDQTICDGEQATLTAQANSGNNYTIGVIPSGADDYTLSGAFLRG